MHGVRVLEQDRRALGRDERAPHHRRERPERHRGHAGRVPDVRLVEEQADLDAVIAHRCLEPRLALVAEAPVVDRPRVDGRRAHTFRRALLAEREQAADRGDQPGQQPDPHPDLDRDRQACRRRTPSSRRRRRTRSIPGARASRSPASSPRSRRTTLGSTSPQIAPASTTRAHQQAEAAPQEPSARRGRGDAEPADQDQRADQQERLARHRVERPQLRGRARRRVRELEPPQERAKPIATPPIIRNQAPGLRFKRSIGSPDRRRAALVSARFLSHGVGLDQREPCPRGRLPSARGRQEATLDRDRVHRGPAAHDRGAQGRRRLVDRGGRPRAAPLEPRQAVLARRGLHEGRPRELLRERRRADRAAPRLPPAHDEADARRRRRRVLLREDRALAHARLDRAVPRDVGGRQEGRDRLPDGERRGGAALRGEPRLHRDAPAPLALRRRRASRLPVLRPRPVPPVHVRGRADRRASHQDPAGPARPDRLPEDERGHRPADLPAGRARRLHLRPGARASWAPAAA